MQISRINRWTYVLCLLLGSVPLCAQQYYISDIQIWGNKRTKERIILRELDVQKGDSVKVHRMEQVINTSRENLENLSLFNYVDICHTPVPDSADQVVISIRVEERWYLFPLINIKLEDRNTSSWLKNFDLNRVTFEFGAQIYNLFGLHHAITTGIQIGYQQAYSFTYKNIALDRRQKHFLTAGMSIQMSHNMNVTTVEDEPLNIKVSDVILEQSLNWHFNYTYRHNVRTTHNILFHYGHKKIADTVLLVNPDYWGSNHRERLNLDLQYFFKTDHRDYAAYPLKGYFLRTGTHIHVSNDLTVRYLQLNANAQHYWQLSNRWYASERLTAGVSVKNTRAYILDQALGYGESALRGYEYHVVDGQHYAHLNSTLKYNILPKTIFILNWLSAFSKFNKIHFALYANAFFDMGAACHQYPGPTNHLSNQFLYSGGLGLDLVTYYDIVLTLNYSVNKQREQGFHFSFKLPFM